MELSNNKKLRKIEKWQGVIEELKLDVSNDISYVSAAQIKKITGEEPRLMAKIDKFELLPKIFKDNNLFLLPISRSDYVVVKGNGYKNLNETELSPKFI